MDTRACLSSHAVCGEKALLSLLYVLGYSSFVTLAETAEVELVCCSDFPRFTVSCRFLFIVLGHIETDIICGPLCRGK